MKISELTELPPTLSTAQAAAVWGVGVDHLWALAHAGKAPVEPLRLGRKLVWPTAKVLRSIGFDPESSEASLTPSARVLPMRQRCEG